MLTHEEAAGGPRTDLGPLRTSGLAFMIAFTGAATPGPMLALVIGQVLAQGVMAAVFILLGHALLEAVFVLGFARGMGRFLTHRKARGLLSLVGGGVLLWMGLDIVKHAGGASLATAQAAAMPYLTLIVAGAGVSLSNPYFTGWWATVGTGQVAAFGLRSLKDYMAFFVGHEMGDVVWYMFVAAVLALGRGWLTDPMYQRLLWVCGAAIVILGLLFLGMGIRYTMACKPETDAPGTADEAPGAPEPVPGE